MNLFKWFKKPSVEREYGPLFSRQENDPDGINPMWACFHFPYGGNSLNIFYDFNNSAIFCDQYDFNEAYKEYRSQFNQDIKTAAMNLEDEIFRDFGFVQNLYDICPYVVVCYTNDVQEVKHASRGMVCKIPNFERMRMYQIRSHKFIQANMDMMEWGYDHPEKREEERKFWQRKIETKGNE